MGVFHLTLSALLLCPHLMTSCESNAFLMLGKALHPFNVKLGRIVAFLAPVPLEVLGVGGGTRGGTGGGGGQSNRVQGTALVGCSSPPALRTSNSANSVTPVDKRF